MNLLPLEPIKDRLVELGNALRFVGYSADFATATKPGGVLANPSAFITLIGAEPYQVHEGSGPLRQTLRVTFCVLLGVKLAGARGEAGLALLEAPSGLVRQSLFGWTHPQAQRSCHLAGEGLEDFDATTGVLFYRLDFETEVRIQEQLP